jgi:hypothetical protein
MSRRPDPARIDKARRAATVRRLEMGGMSAERAESWMARWETMADAEERPRDSAYWDAAWAWIAAQASRVPARGRT